MPEPTSPPEDRLARLVVDSAIKVHTALGPGLLESTYEACLVHELVKAGVPVERQKPMPVTYDGVNLDVGYRLDLVVGAVLVVEVKSVDGLQPIHTAQLLSYLRLGGYKLGLLVNFNVVRLKEGIKRVVNGL
jgi:GxxExxY protein